MHAELITPTELILEENEIIAGRAKVTRGYDDQIENIILGPGDRVLFGSNEWYAIRNLSDQGSLITRQVQTPGTNGRI